jgi:hypothetical protein
MNLLRPTSGKPTLTQRVTENPGVPQRSFLCDICAFSEIKKGKKLFAHCPYLCVSLSLLVTSSSYGFRYFTIFTAYLMSMRDFTLNTFHQLLNTFLDQQYAFQPFAEFLKNPVPRTIILRHDVDARKMNSLKTAQIENEMGISGTYYFRMVPGSFNEDVIKQIASLGHEIGYHYEDISRCAARGMRPSDIALVPRTGMISTGRNAAGSKRLQDHKTARLQDKILPDRELVDMAIVSFRENLAKLRRVVPVETICMHGSPLSKYDNRLLWEKYDYRDFGITGEPYFDIDFEEVLYLTDTGRCWDGDSVNIRDKAKDGRWKVEGKGGTKRFRDLETEREKALEPRTPNHRPILRFHSTFDIIHAAGSLPDKIMITVHPQRWDNKPLTWVRELVWQNVKNIGKRIVTFWQR